VSKLLTTFKIHKTLKTTYKKLIYKLLNEFIHTHFLSNTLKHRIFAIIYLTKLF